MYQQLQTYNIQQTQTISLRLKYKDGLFFTFNCLPSNTVSWKILQQPPFGTAYFTSPAFERCKDSPVSFDFEIDPKTMYYARNVSDEIDIKTLVNNRTIYNYKIPIKMDASFRG